MEEKEEHESVEEVEVEEREEVEVEERVELLIFFLPWERMFFIILKVRFVVSERESVCFEFLGFRVVVGLVLCAADEWREKLMDRAVSWM